MKKMGELLAAILMAVFIMSMTALASETCSMSDGKSECEIWWFYDNDQHWRACVIHEDAAGNDITVTDPVDHEFVDGVCTVCERPEPSRILGGTSYWIVLLVVGGAGLLISNKYKMQKLGRNDMTTFGLDKFRKL